MNLSIILCLYNEEESLRELVEWIVRVCKERYTYEIIMIDDGSSDRSWKEILALSSEYPNIIRGVRFQKNYGKSAALNEGFLRAKGDVVITMDADLQDSPDEIPQLYDKIKQDGYDLVSGWKRKRYDQLLTKNLPSKLFNTTTRKLTGIQLHDFNCGLKAYHQDVVKSVEVYGEMHRYIPVLAHKNGFTKIGEQVVQHQARKYGYSKFGWDRFVNGFLDLGTVLFVTKFSRRPMHFFGLLGIIFFLVGLGATIYLLILKFFLNDGGIITNRISLYIALTCLIIGVQLFLAGFISEMINLNRSGHSSRQILIKEQF